MSRYYKHGADPRDCAECPSQRTHTIPESHANNLERIEETWRADAGWQRAREAEAKLEELREAVRNFRDVSGRYHTQLAAERLIALLPESETNGI